MVAQEQEPGNVLRYSLPAYRALLERGISAATLAVFGVTSGSYRGHSGWLYPVYGPGRALLGVRFKAAPAASLPASAAAPPPTAYKYAWVECQEGAARLLYGGGCVRADAPAVLCAGEPDCWLLHTLMVPAATFLRGEGAGAPGEAVDELVARAPALVLVAYDRDQAGQSGAPAVARALRDAGLRARALALPADLPEHGDLTDLYRARGRDRRAFLAALAGCPDLPVPPPSQPPGVRRQASGRPGPWADFNATHDLLEMVEGVVRLKKSGTSWVGLCPFHAERAPSFHVYADHYYCYGCQAWGSAWDFDRWLKGERA
jgi:hypothetical protein